MQYPDDFNEKMDFNTIITSLKERANPANIEGMARFGINPESCLGISIPNIEAIAKKIGKDPQMASALWRSGIHEARILAIMVQNPKDFTYDDADAWINDVNSWDLCDQFMNRLLRKTPFAGQKALEWCDREETFVKRAGFVLMATLAVHDKKAENDDFDVFFSLIKRDAADERNFVKKAVNWALRQIGKKNLVLNRKALETAESLLAMNSKSAKWIARDAIRELTSEKVQARLKMKTA